MKKQTETASSKVTAKEVKAIKKVAEKLLTLLEVNATLSCEPAGEGVDIVLETKDTGVVIGYHGEVLESLQLLIALCASKKIERFVRVSVEVGDYKKNRISWLENLALSAKEKVQSTGQEVVLPNLKSWERRVVHVFLQEDKDITSESYGEGKDRALVIKPRA